MDLSLLKQSLIAHEGSRLLPYVDTTGHITIGVGHNLSVDGVPQSVVDTLLQLDINAAIILLNKLLPWTLTLDDVRYRAFVELVFNLGANLLQFRKSLAAAQSGNWSTCVAELKNSRWDIQVGHRAANIEYQLLHGEDPPFGTALASA